MLFSEGFRTAKMLSYRLVQLYELGSQMLMAQKHYDFGLRALRVVLLLAGSVRPKYTDTAERVEDREMMALVAESARACSYYLSKQVQRNRKHAHFGCSRFGC